LFLKSIYSVIYCIYLCCFGSLVGLQKAGLTPLLFVDEQDGMCPYVCGGSRCNPKFRSFLLGMPGESSWKLSFKLGPRTAFGSRGRPNPHGPRPFAKRKGPCNFIIPIKSYNIWLNVYNDT
jgi:hypothetical protein